jgi:hypothetical protein
LYLHKIAFLKPYLTAYFWWNDEISAFAELADWHFDFSLLCRTTAIHAYSLAVMPHLSSKLATE